MGDRPHQKDRQRDDIHESAAALTDPKVPGGRVSEAGVRGNISVALQYLNAWLSGTGAAAIDNLMEDAATAEISRAQLWQWRTHRTALASGEMFTGDLYLKLKGEELEKLQGEQLDTAAQLLGDLVLASHFEPFLTLRTYPHLP